MDNRIQALSFAWMLGVVLFHAGSAGCSSFYNSLISDFRVGGVSYFYIVSGYFLMKHYEGEVYSWWKVAVLKRAKTLLIPYLIWCSFGIQGFDLLRQYGLTSLGPLANPPLWYVKFLFLFCLASPVVLIAVNFLSRRKMFVPALLTLVLVLPCIPLPLKFSLVLSLLMFTFGIGLAFVSEKEKARLESLTVMQIGFGIWVAGLVIRSLIPDLPVQLKWAVNVYSALSLVIVSWGLLRRIEFVYEIPCFKVTFFVYCLHGILLRQFCFFGYPPMNGLFVFLVCVVIGMCVSRFTPLLYRILTGNR